MFKQYQKNAIKQYKENEKAEKQLKKQLRQQKKMDKKMRKETQNKKSWDICPSLSKNRNSRLTVIQHNKNALL